MIYWLIAAALVLILELFAGTVYLLVVSAALFGAGLAALLFDNHAVSTTTAAVLATAGIVWVNRRLKSRRKTGNGETALDDLDVGQTVHINRRLHGNRYEVHYRGAVWQAEAANALAVSQPQTAVITGKNGNVLLIHLH
ncbi:NfeD family protein [Neisseria musculi]|uniref:NfeD-like C-terminal partner-binding family protein n=1 Tax=Neisseria musculi TaxID=1815583 RepID=A0A7H1M8D6_9NEIS|nr:NfeD family protein [Neisseria musculi]QNT57901.1 nfeD-like partner-binding domain protein [Neisseria musculi]